MKRKLKIAICCLVLFSVAFSSIGVFAWEGTSTCSGSPKSGYSGSGRLTLKNSYCSASTTASYGCNSSVAKVDTYWYEANGRLYKAGGKTASNSGGTVTATYNANYGSAIGVSASGTHTVTCSGGVWTGHTVVKR